MNQQQFIEWLKAQIGAQSHSAYAASVGITGAYLSEILSEKKEPGEKLLKAIGFEMTKDWHKEEEK